MKEQAEYLAQVAEDSIEALAIERDGIEWLVNPQNRSCETCTHFVETPCCDFPSDGCGCKGLNGCNQRAFRHWSYHADQVER